MGRSFLEAVLGFVGPLLALGLATRLAAIGAMLALLGSGVMGTDGRSTGSINFSCSA